MPFICLYQQNKVKKMGLLLGEDESRVCGYHQQNVPA